MRGRKQDTLAGANKGKEELFKPMTVADREQILRLAQTKTIKEIAGLVGFSMDWIAAVIDSQLPDRKRSHDLTRSFFPLPSRKR